MSRADSQVARSRLSVCCFYMLLRFDSHENRGVDRFARLPFERGQISPSRAHMNTLSGPARQIGLEIVSQRMLYSI